MYPHVAVFHIASFCREIGEYTRVQFRSAARHKRVLDAIKAFHHLAAFEVPLPRTAATIEMIVDGISKNSLDILKLDTRCEQLLDDLQHDLENYHFLAIDRRLAGYLHPKWPPASALADRSPEAAAELRSAARCFAIGEHTACVLHLNRTMEYGLRVAARSLGIAKPTLAAIAEAIEKKMTAKYAEKGRDWRQAEPFYAQLLMELNAFTRGYRNPAMHSIEVRYTAAEADRLMRHVIEFMRLLSDRFPDFNAKRPRPIPKQKRDEIIVR